MDKIELIISETIFMMKVKSITRKELSENLKICPNSIKKILSGQGGNVKFLQSIIKYVSEK